MSAADLKTNQTFPYSILICIWLAVRGWLYSLRQAAFFKVLFHAISCILWQSGHQYLYPAVHLQHAFECYITQANIALKNGMLNNVKWCYRHKIFIFQLCCCCLYWFFFFFLMQIIFVFTTYANSFILANCDDFYVWSLAKAECNFLCCIITQLL